MTSKKQNDLSVFRFLHLCDRKNGSERCSPWADVECEKRVWHNRENSKAKAALVSGKSAVLVDFFAVLPEISTSTADFGGSGMEEKTCFSLFCSRLALTLQYIKKKDT